MTAFDDLAETIRRQRKSVDDSLDETSVRSVETASILTKIEELRRRSEVTNRAAGSVPDGENASRS